MAPLDAAAGSTEAAEAAVVAEAAEAAGGWAGDASGEAVGEEAGEEARENLGEDSEEDKEAGEAFGEEAFGEEAGEADFGFQEDLPSSGAAERAAIGAIGDGAAEEFSAGLGHWAIIFFVIFGVWWWLARGGRSAGGRGEAGAGGRGGRAAAAGRPSAEDLRRKRLEALERSGSASEKALEPEEPATSSQLPESAAATSTTAASATGAASSAEGLRRRGAGGGSASSVEPAAAAAEGNVAESEEAEAKEADGKEPESLEAHGKEAVENEAEGKAALAAAPAATTPVPFVLKARGIYRGSSSVRTLEGLSSSSTVGALVECASEAFALEKGERLRLFYTGKELTNPRTTLETLGVAAGAVLQAMFIAAPAPIAAAALAAEAPAAVAPAPQAAGIDDSATDALRVVVRFEQEGPLFAIRAQGTLTGGAPQSHAIEDVHAATTVLELESEVLRLFGAGEDVRLRLFFMGRELKDADLRLGLAGLKSGSSVQAMFVPGTARSLPAGASLPRPAATLPAAAAAAADTEAAAPVSPADAWQAMAALELQLQRRNDASEEASVRQMTEVLRSMLATVVHGNNPSLMQFASVMVPDIHKIWNFEPTREHLRGLLAEAGGAGVGSSSSSGSAS